MDRTSTRSIIAGLIFVLISSLTAVGCDSCYSSTGIQHQDTPSQF